MNMMRKIETSAALSNGFPLTLAACRKADGIQWAIGDALLIECGPPGPPSCRDGSHARIVEAAQYLAANGLEYVAGYLRQLRKISHAFRPEERSASHTWSVHNRARSPEILGKIIAAYPGREITDAMAKEWRITPKEKIERAVAKRMERAAKIVQPTGTAMQPVRFRSFDGLERGDEIAAIFSAKGRGRAIISSLAKERGGKELWSLFLQAKDAGFLTRGTDPKIPTIKMLFPDAPISWAKNYLLTEAKDREYIRDELMPAAITNRDAIIAEPERIEIILREHFGRVGHAAKKVIDEKKLVAARKTMSGDHKDVVLFGKRYWPLIDKSHFDYDFEQLSAAWWSFNDMWIMARLGNSPGACAHGIRFLVGRLQRFVSGQDAGSPVRENMRRMLYVIADLADALEACPDGVCDPPTFPRG